MKFEGLKKNKVINTWTVYSTGGGSISDGSSHKKEKKESVYSMTKIADIKDWCDEHGHSYWEYVEEHEGKEIWDYLREVWRVMRRAIENGLENE